MGNTYSNETIITTKFYSEDPTNDPKQTYGKEQLPKHHKCNIKELRLHQSNECDMNSFYHYAVWQCKKEKN